MGIVVLTNLIGKNPMEILMKTLFFATFLLSGVAFAQPKIEMIESNPLADLYHLKVTGFEKGEKIHVRGQSLHEVVESDSVFPGGELTLLHMVAVEGKAKGTAHLTITGEKSGAADFEIDWVNPKILEFKATSGSAW